MTIEEFEIQYASESLFIGALLNLVGNPDPNLSTPVEILTKLSTDKSKWVRWNVAGNPNR